jgi:hypothetical protein
MDRVTATVNPPKTEYFIHTRRDQQGENGSTPQPKGRLSRLPGATLRLVLVTKVYS